MKLNRSNSSLGILAISFLVLVSCDRQRQEGVIDDSTHFTESEQTEIAPLYNGDRDRLDNEILEFLTLNFEEGMRELENRFPSASPQEKFELLQGLFRYLDLYNVADPEIRSQTMSFFVTAYALRHEEDAMHAPYYIDNYLYDLGLYGTPIDDSARDAMLERLAVGLIEGLDWWLFGIYIAPEFQPYIDDALVSFDVVELVAADMANLGRVRPSWFSGEKYAALVISARNGNRESIRQLLVGLDGLHLSRRSDYFKQLELVNQPEIQHFLVEQTFSVEEVATSDRFRGVPLGYYAGGTLIRLLTEFPYPDYLDQIETAGPHMDEAVATIRQWVLDNVDEEILSAAGVR